MASTISGRSGVDRDPVAATEEERTAIAHLHEVLSGQGAPLRIIGPRGEELRLPRPLRILLVQAAEALLAGNAVVATPLYRELTTNEAARLLNVSRPYLYRLLDEGEIPYTRTGTHRRIKLSDLLAYRRRRDAECAAALAELSQLSQEYGLYEAEERERH